jgi:sarcosine oxidase subunit gamma
MADWILAAAAPLDGAILSDAPAASGATTARPLDGFAFAAVVARRRQREALQAKAREVFGLELPEGPRFAEGRTMSALGTAPDAWLFVARSNDPRWAEDLAHTLHRLASVADQSDAYLAVRVAGPKAQALLSRGVGLDLHDRAFPVGAGAVTAAAHLGLILWRREQEAYDLLSFRSYAGSFWRWLMETGAEFGLRAVGGG